MSAAATPRQTAKNQTDLDRAAALCKDAIEGAARAQSLATEKPAQEAAWEAACASMEAANLLVAAGAASPFKTSAPASDPHDLAALSSLADPETDDLLFHLEQCLAVAERIDARRGRTVSEDIPLSPGESRGTDLAETISEIALRVRGEVGPKGRD